MGTAVFADLQGLKNCAGGACESDNLIYHHTDERRKEDHS
jgi:hypothetical protein